MNKELNEGLISSIIDGAQANSSLANPQGTNPEEIRNEVAEDVKKSLGNDNIDISKLSTEEMLALYKRLNGIDAQQESLVTKAFADRFGYELNEARTVMDDMLKEFQKSISTDDLYDELDKATIKGFIPDKYCYDKCFDKKYVPTSLEDCLEKCSEKVD